MPLCSFTRSKQRLGEAARYIPGGVSSHFRLGVSPNPLVFEHADGVYLHDVAGNRLIDYYMALGPMILGHTPADVIAAAKAQLDRGLLYGGQSEIEFEAGRLICNLEIGRASCRQSVCQYVYISVVAGNFINKKP